MFLFTGRSFLTVEDLKKALAQVAPHLAHHSIESAFRSEFPMLVLMFVG